jgi:hypothetical protein
MLHYKYYTNLVEKVFKIIMPLPEYKVNHEHNLPLSGKYLYRTCLNARTIIRQLSTFQKTN